MLTLFKKNDVFPMLAFDHRGSFVKLLAHGGAEPTLAETIQVKKDILEAVLPYMSGTLIDEDYGLPALESMHTPLPYLLPLEKTGYTDALGERITEIFRTPDELRARGAQAAKLLLYTNPNVPSWKTQMDTAHKQIESCREAQMPLFLEFVLYKAGDIDSGTVVENVQKAIDEGVRPDVWKIPYPGSREACMAITDMVGDTPWILLTGGTTFEMFKEQYEAARDAGALGFLAGRALWQEVGALWRDENAYHTFLKNELPRRFESLL